MRAVEPSHTGWRMRTRGRPLVSMVATVHHTMRRTRDSRVGWMSANEGSLTTVRPLGQARTHEIERLRTLVLVRRRIDDRGEGRCAERGLDALLRHRAVGGRTLARRSAHAVDQGLHLFGRELLAP